MSMLFNGCFFDGHFVKRRHSTSGFHCRLFGSELFCLLFASYFCFLFSKIYCYIRFFLSEKQPSLTMVTRNVSIHKWRMWYCIASCFLYCKNSVERKTVSRCICALLCPIYVRQFRTKCFEDVSRYCFLPIADCDFISVLRGLSTFEEKSAALWIYNILCGIMNI